MIAEVFIITGSQRKGKTVFIQDIQYHLQAQNVPVCGVISPGIYLQEKRIKIMALNVETGEQQELAQYLPGWDATMPEKVWKMNEMGVKWGNLQLINCEPQGKVFLLDEIGIYELLEGGGWQAGLEILQKKRYRKAIITVRKELASLIIKICEKDNISWQILDLDRDDGQKQDFLDDLFSTLSEEL